MARDHARVLVAIWQDKRFLALSGRAQRMYLLLLSQPRLSLCGVLDVTPGRWVNLAADDTPEGVRAALDELSETRFVVVDDLTEELVIRSFVRHDGVCDSPNLIQAMWKAWAGVQSETLRAVIVAELPDKAFTSGFGSDKKPYEPPGEALELRQNNGSPKGSGKGSPTPSPAPDPEAATVAGPSPNGSARDDADSILLDLAQREADRFPDIVNRTAWVRKRYTTLVAQVVREDPTRENGLAIAQKMAGIKPSPVSAPPCQNPECMNGWVYIEEDGREVTAPCSECRQSA